MKDYTKECWYCGSKNMEPVETWYQCRDCRATHVPQPKSYPRYDLVEAHWDKALSYITDQRGSSLSPSKGLGREAMRARGAKAKTP